jgi:hypothetical protein
MKIMQKVVISLAVIIIVLIPVTGVSGDHGGGLVSIDSFEMENDITTTISDEVPLSVIVTNNDPEEAYSIKFRGVLKDPDTGEYYRNDDGSGKIVFVDMTNIGGSSLYFLHPNETKLLELEIDLWNIPYGVWSVDIGVEIYEFDTYTDVITTPSFEVIKNPEPVESNETPGFSVILACSVLLLAAWIPRR